MSKNVPSTPTQALCVTALMHLVTGGGRILSRPSSSEGSVIPLHVVCLNLLLDFQRSLAAAEESLGGGAN